MRLSKPKPVIKRGEVKTFIDDLMSHSINLAAFARQCRIICTIPKKPIEGQSKSRSNKAYALALARKIKAEKGVVRCYIRNRQHELQIVIILRRTKQGV